MEKVPDTARKGGVGSLRSSGVMDSGHKAQLGSDNYGLSELKDSKYGHLDGAKTLASPGINYLSPLLSTKRDGGEDITSGNGAGLLYSGYNVRDEDVKTLPFQSPDRPGLS